MNKPIAVVLLALGMVLIVFSATDSLSLNFLRYFTGFPDHQAFWLLVAGLITSTIGLVGTLRVPKH